MLLLLGWLGSGGGGDVGTGAGGAVAVADLRQHPLQPCLKVRDVPATKGKQTGGGYKWTRPRGLTTAGMQVLRKPGCKAPGTMQRSADASVLIAALSLMAIPGAKATPED